MAMAIKEEQFSYYSQLTKRIDSGMDYQAGSKAAGDDLSPAVKGMLVAAIVIGGSVLMLMLQ